MKWRYFLIKAFVVYFLLWWVLIYAYGWFLINQVVPANGIGVDEWLQSYYQVGVANVVIGLIISFIWFWLDRRSLGKLSSLKYYGLLLLACFITSENISHFVMPTLGGESLMLTFTNIVVPIGFCILSYNRKE